MNPLERVATTAATTTTDNYINSKDIIIIIFNPGRKSLDFENYKKSVNH